jgi:hypothetical protein
VSGADAASYRFACSKINLISVLPWINFKGLSCLVSVGKLWTQINSVHGKRERALSRTATSLMLVGCYFC